MTAQILLEDHRICRHFRLCVLLSSPTALCFYLGRLVGRFVGWFVSRITQNCGKKSFLEEVVLRQESVDYILPGSDFESGARIFILCLIVICNVYEIALCFTAIH